MLEDIDDRDTGTSKRNDNGRRDNHRGTNGGVKRQHTFLLVDLRGGIGDADVVWEDSQRHY